MSETMTSGLVDTIYEILSMIPTTQRSPESRQCRTCGQHVRQVPRYAGGVDIVYVWPLDEYGRCGVCAWDD